LSSVYDTVPPPTVRKTKRKGVRVSVALDGVSEHNFWSDLSLDVARGGVFVATYHSLPVGTEVDVEIGIAGATPTVIPGVVRWARKHAYGSDASPGMGIALTDVSSDARQLMKAFIERRAPIVFESDEARASHPSLPDA
jgi:uncharacterized protein (TIGR02266 family)